MRFSPADFGDLSCRRSRVRRPPPPPPSTPRAVFLANTVKPFQYTDDELKLLALPVGELSESMIDARERLIRMKFYAEQVARGQRIQFIQREETHNGASIAAFEVPQSRYNPVR